MKTKWLQAVFSLHNNNIELLEMELLNLNALSITYMDSKDEPIYEPNRENPELWQNLIILSLFDKEDDCLTLRKHLEFLSLQFNSSLVINELQDEIWQRKYLEYFKPMCFGDNIWVIPSEYEIIDKNATNIFLNPGLAFGTGTHPTTALCLEFLDKFNIRHKKVLDYGAGSGILAIAASKLGAQTVIATDIDEQALFATKQNMANNNIDNIKTLFPENLNGQYELILANILADILLGKVQEFKQLSAENADIVLSGVLVSQVEPLKNTYEKYFKLININTKDDWALLHFKNL